MKKKFGIVLAVLALGVGVAACNSGTPSAVSQDQNTSASILGQMEQAQPAPKFKWSQIREDLIEIESAQANTIQTTSFFFNLGVQDPIQSCPSIGFPVASTDQITNPQQVAYDQGSGGGGNVAIGQIDPNGIYGGDSTGTYVVCTAANGQPYFHYWEGYVDTVSGPAVWDAGSHSVKLTGPSSVNIKTHS